YSTWHIRQSYLSQRKLPFFPTRRSSDLHQAENQQEDGDGGQQTEEPQRRQPRPGHLRDRRRGVAVTGAVQERHEVRGGLGVEGRSEEHTSELQSRENLVCRLLLEKKKQT